MKSMIILAPLVLFGLIACEEPSAGESHYSSNASPPTNAEAPARKLQKPFEIGGPWPPPSSQLAPDLLKDNYLVVLDDSGSMSSGGKMEQAKTALKKFVSIIPSDANLGYMVINDDSLLLPFGSSTENRQNFKKLVNQTQPTGTTPLRRTMKNAYRHISKQCAAQLGYGTYHIVLVTDGEATSANDDPVGLTRYLVNTSTIEVHVVGFHVDSHSMNLPDCVDYHTAKSAEQLAKVFEAVAAESEDFVSPAEFEGL